MIPIDFNSRGRITKEVNGDHQLFLLTSILQNVLFYVQHKKETQTGLERHEGE